MTFHAFDPGKALGWAFWACDKPSARTIDLDADAEGAIYTRARRRLLEVLQRGDRVAIEGAVMPKTAKGGHQSIGSRLVLFGIRAVIFQVCYESGITPIEYEPQVWRSRYMGVTAAPRTVAKKLRRKWIKARAQQEAVTRGWGQVSEDEADALGILHCLRYELDREYRDRGTLFDR